MPVISCGNDLWQNYIELNNFWDGEETIFSVTDKTKIISFAQKIPSIDPLAFLEKFAQPHDLHFYWENPAKQEAIAAYGVTKHLNINSSDRFIAAQKFIQTCLKQTIRKGDINSTAAGPYLFCSFTFFSDSDCASSPFPPATIFLPKFQVIKKNKSCLFIVNFPVQSKQNNQLLLQEVKQKIKQINWAELQQIKRKFESNYQSIDPSNNGNSNYFKSVVTSALNSIAIDELTKIVIGHATDVISATSFRVIESLDNLRQRHPDCYIFSTSNGQGHNFIGASPERLVSIQNKQLVTDALAGSAPRGKTATEDLQLANLLLKNRKEKREHQAVSDFLLQRLRQLGLKPQQLPLQLLQLSNIQHLWTPIYAHLPMDLNPLEIVAHLHPTPAVAGLPTEFACEQIRCYENFDRSLYAAPLGWVDHQGNCEFIVGIRSALIEGNRARLYAGAGIVSGSNPDKEFVEIQLKLQSLLKALV
jgi:menaquinone-specific isochorismate synthase